MYSDVPCFTFVSLINFTVSEKRVVWQSDLGGVYSLDTFCSKVMAAPNELMKYCNSTSSI